MQARAVTASVGRRLGLTAGLLAILAAGLVLGSAIARRLGGLAGAEPVRPGVPAPEIAGSPWINSGPLTMAALRGRVVLVEFWTYG
jgi:hypothetical protein